MTQHINYLAKLAAQGKLDRREFMGKAAAVGVSTAAAGSLLSSAAMAEGPKKGGTLKAGLGGGESTNSLDPAAFLTQVSHDFGKCWGETLVEVSRIGEINFRLAESIEPTADAKTWHFTIRKGVEFHNGKSVTAQDVLKTMQRHSGEDTKSGALGVMRNIESMKADGDVFSVTLKTANADLPYLMSDYHLIIQPDGGMDAPDAGIGTGPYKVAVNEPGVRHVGERNPNYWDPSRGHADQVEIVVLNDATARTAALQGGQVHMINRVEPKVADLLERVPGLQVKSVSGRGHYVFLMHCNTAPFDNNDLRLALKYAVDREEMVDKILRGYGSVGNDMPINGGYPLFSEDIEQRSFDPDKAKFHFKKSGHEGPVQLRTAGTAFAGAVDAAQLFQQSAAKCGITLDVKREPDDGYWTEVWNKQPFCASYWGGSRPVQDQMYSTAYLSTADWNDTRFFRPDFDKLLIEARGELDQAKRIALYREMGVMVRDEGGVIVPMFNDFIAAVSDKVGGYEDDPSGEMMNGFALAKTWLA
ncbi:ABC transporter substrate-binding protein [Kiloniella sp.]|uniref:ABC transporter substrate-binding protein n=1 Tax=Kiloniella sp. TaxID=1938587 RepID=UPI003A8D3B35